MTKKEDFELNPNEYEDDDLVEEALPIENGDRMKQVDQGLPEDEGEEDTIESDGSDSNNDQEDEIDFELLTTPRVLAELSDDPVRLYLKDIGQIELLQVDHEFWLSARMEAMRRLDLIGRKHPLVRSDRGCPKAGV